MAGLEVNSMNYDRVTAAKLGLTVKTLDSAVYSAFGQSEVSIIYYAVKSVLRGAEVAPQYWQSPEGLKDIYLQTSGGGGNIPLLAVAKGQAKHDTAGRQPYGLIPLGLPCPLTSRRTCP